MKKLFIEKEGGVASYLTILAITAIISITLLVFTVLAFIQGNWQLGVGLVALMVFSPLIIRGIIGLAFILLAFLDFSPKKKKTTKKDKDNENENK